eukprot:5910927-Prymnesium_polylepis.1
MAFEAHLERMDEHTALVSERSQHDGNQLGVLASGIPAKVALDDALVTLSVAASGKRAFDEDAAAGERLKLDVAAQQ